MAFVAVSLAAGATLGTAATVGGLALTAASVGMSMANQPTQPNLSASSRALSDTNAAILPIQRGLTAAQQSGGDYTFSLPNGTDAAGMGIATTGQGWHDANGNLISTDQNYGQTALSALENPFAASNYQIAPQTKQAYQSWQKANGQAGGLARLFGNSNGKSGSTSKFDPTSGLTWNPGKTTINGVPVEKNKDGSYTVSFKGYGQGDIQAANAQKNAASQLELSKKYDPQFIAQALEQQKLADPESFAARAEESKLIQDQINRPINSPVSDMLNQQVQDSLDAAKNNNLTGMDSERLNAAVAQALAERGGSATPGDFAQPLTSGFQGEQRQQNAAQEAMGFLSSGSSPEDIAYRREQQNLGNLSAEVNGKTPESQFASMSGAQSGATPMMTASPLPVLPGSQDQAASQTAIQNAQSTNRFNSNQINPWMQGISGLINVGSIAGNLGWKPFAPAS